MILLIDSDVLLDVALDRQPYSEPASELPDVLEQGAGDAFIAWHTVSNFHYLVSPHRGKEAAKSFLLELVLHYAAGLQMKDFEDALQVAAAASYGAEAIATRNIRDYVNSPIRAVRPEEILRELLHRK